MTDRSYWFDERVVTASRDFVCARLLSFEDPKEKALLKRICIDPITKRVENTAFAILSPDGKQFLVEGQRYPSGVAKDAEELAALMRKIAGRYPKKKTAATPAERGLPVVVDLKRAVNVAACDDQPLVVVSAKDAAKRKTLVDAVRTLAWDARFVGRLVYVVVDDPMTLGPIGAKRVEGILVVGPETYGRRATRLARSATAEGAAKALADGLAAWKPRGEFDGEAHVEKGKAQGITWTMGAPR